MSAPTRDPIPELEGFDRFIGLKDAAYQLGVTTMWLYKRRGQLPFLVSLPVPEGFAKSPVRVSVARLKAYMETSPVVPAKPRRKKGEGR